MDHLRNRHFGLYTSNRSPPELDDQHIRHIRHNLAAFLFSEHTRSESEKVYFSPNDLVHDILVTRRCDTVGSLEVTSVAVSHPDNRLLPPQQAVFVDNATRTMVFISGSATFANVFVQILELASLEPAMMIQRHRLALETLLALLEVATVTDIHLVYTVPTNNDAVRLIKISIPEKDFRELRHHEAAGPALLLYLHKHSGIKFANLQLVSVTSLEMTVLQTRVNMGSPERIVSVIMEKN